MKGTASLVRWQGRAPREYSSGPSRTRASGHRTDGRPEATGRPVPAYDLGVRISAKVDYAVRAMCELAAHDEATPLKAETIAEAQAISLSFLENILVDLKRAGLVRASRGRVGGYSMTRPATTVSIADIIRAVEGPLASVRGQRPEDIAYAGPAEPLSKVWIAVRASLRSVAEHVTLADIASGELPEHVATLASDPEAWVTR